MGVMRAAGLPTCHKAGRWVSVWGLGLRGSASVPTCARTPKGGGTRRPKAKMAFLRPGTALTVLTCQATRMLTSLGPCDVATLVSDRRAWRCDRDGCTPSCVLPHGLQPFSNARRLPNVVACDSPDDVCGVAAFAFPCTDGQDLLPSHAPSLVCGVQFICQRRNWPLAAYEVHVVAVVACHHSRFTFTFMGMSLI